VFARTGELPLFNPDLESAPADAVRSLYAAVEAADALIIASPEYAHGITAVIKNLLDWLVGYPPFVGKPVLVLNASPRAHHADAALRETLQTMNARLLGPQSLALPLLGYCNTSEQMLATPALVARIDALLEMLATLDQAGGD
jgi:NAD(P)H-dependent FMN reductase